MNDSTVTVTLPKALVDDLRERRPRIRGPAENVLIRLADTVLAVLDSAPAVEAADVEMVDELVKSQRTLGSQTAFSVGEPHREALAQRDAAVEALLTRLASLRERAERESAERTRLVLLVAVEQVAKDNAIARATSAERERDALGARLDEATRDARKTIARLENRPTSVDVSVRESIGADSRSAWALWCVGEGWCPYGADVEVFARWSHADARRSEWLKENPAAHYEIRQVVALPASVEAAAEAETAT